MPRTIVRENAPAAVLGLIGAYYPVTHGWAPGIAHILGPPGPRGGTRTMCGTASRSAWVNGSITFPTSNWRDTQRWRYVCVECKQAMGGVLNA